MMALGSLEQPPAGLAVKLFLKADNVSTDIAELASTLSTAAPLAASVADTVLTRLVMKANLGFSGQQKEKKMQKKRAENGLVYYKG